jgi:hypothetical protein
LIAISGFQSPRTSYSSIDTCDCDDEEETKSEHYNDSIGIGDALNPNEIARGNRKHRVVHGSDSSDSDGPSYKSSKSRKVIHYSDSGSDVSVKSSLKSVKSKRKHRVNKALTNSDSDSDVKQSRNCKKKSWSESEKAIFKRAVSKYVEDKVMPPRHALVQVVRKLGTRTLSQVRVRVNNLILGKQQNY